MSDYVKKQLHHIGFNEKTHPDIYHAFRDMEEVDFRGLIFAKIENLIPNQPIAVQVLILKHIDTLRQNATLIQAQASPEGVSPISGSADLGDSGLRLRQGQRDKDDDSDSAAVPVQVKQENTPDKAIDYSSDDSDVEILSSSDSDFEVKYEEPMGNVIDVDSDDSVQMEPTPKKKKLKRIDLIKLEDEEGQRQDEESVEAEAGKSKTIIGSRSRPRKKNASSSSSNQTEASARNPDLPRKSIVFKFINITVRGVKNSTFLNIDKHLRVDFDRSGNYKAFFDKYGESVVGLKLDNWRFLPEGVLSQNSSLLSADKILFNLCPNLEILSLGEYANKPNFPDTQDQEENAQEEWAQGLADIGKLKQIDLDMNSTTKTQITQIMMSPIKIIFEKAKNLEVLRFTFRASDEADIILAIIQETNEQGYLQNLTELCMESKCSVLHSQNIDIISALSLPQLIYLELKCGLVDVSGESIQKLLNHFSTTLQVFNCPGMIFGSESKYFKIQVPRMNSLTYFCLGTETFALTKIQVRVRKSTTPGISREQNLSCQTRRDQKVVYGEETLDFIKFGICFGYVYPKLEIVRAGSKCFFEDLHFFNFPALKSFHVHGPWDRMIKLPKETSRFATYETVQNLQMPDSLTNVLLIPNLLRSLPNLKKVWMWLPSAQVLNSFLRLAAANSKIIGIWLKTNFCFSWTFEEMLIGRERAEERNPMELRKIQMIKKYKYWKEWVNFYSVDIPSDLLDLDDDEEKNEAHADFQVLPSTASATGTGTDEEEKLIKYFNTKLKFFKIEHIGRGLPIPQGNIHFNEPGCEYSGWLNVLNVCPRYPFFSKNTQKYLPKYDYVHSSDSRSVNSVGNNGPSNLKCKKTD